MDSDGLLSYTGGLQTPDAERANPLGLPSACLASPENLNYHRTEGHSAMRKAGVLLVIGLLQLTASADTRVVTLMEGEQFWGGCVTDGGQRLLGPWPEPRQKPVNLWSDRWSMNIRIKDTRLSTTNSSWATRSSSPRSWKRGHASARSSFPRHVAGRRRFHGRRTDDRWD